MQNGSSVGWNKYCTHCIHVSTDVNNVRKSVQEVFCIMDAVLEVSMDVNSVARSVQEVVCNMDNVQELSCNMDNVQEASADVNNSSAT